jgi:hypothetical protein
MRFNTTTALVFLISLAGPQAVQCADALATGANANANASASAQATIVDAADVYPTDRDIKELFKIKAGVLTVLIASAPVSGGLLKTACSIASGAGIQCNPATSLQTASDGTLKNPRGISVSLSPSEGYKLMIAMLAFN